jgi:hypothetical protein
MVDGLAAVELAALLLDPTPEPVTTGPDGWQPGRTPDSVSLLLDGVVDRSRQAVEFGRPLVGFARHRRRLFGRAGKRLETARALTRSLEAATSETGLNEQSSAGRRLASVWRPLADLKQIKQQFGTTVNDILLAVAAGGLRRFLERQSKTRGPLVIAHERSASPICRRGERGAGKSTPIPRHAAPGHAGVTARRTSLEHDRRDSASAAVAGSSWRHWTSSSAASSAVAPRPARTSGRLRARPRRPFAIAMKRSLDAADNRTTSR